MLAGMVPCGAVLFLGRQLHNDVLILLGKVGVQASLPLGVFIVMVCAFVIMMFDDPQSEPPAL